MDYNGVKNLLAISGFSSETDFCGNGNLTCNFVTMYTGDNLDLLWSQTFDGMNQNVMRSSVSFSPDGSLVAVLI